MSETFKQVLFDSSSNSYPIDCDVECKYSVTASYTPNSKDWIGVFRVGWSSIKECITYTWVQLPLQLKDDQTQVGSVKFLAAGLPNEDGEFYQFVYFDNKGSMRGASVPFRFKSPLPDDFIEEELEDSDMLVITTRQMQLESKVAEYETELIKLKQINRTMDKDRDRLLEKLGDIDRKLKEEKAEKGRLNVCLEESFAKCDVMRTEIDQLHDQITHNALDAEKLNEILESKENAKKNAEQAVMDLTEKVKKLTNEKDALNGELEALKYQKTQYAQHVAEIEQVKQKYQTELEELRVRLEKQSYTREDIDILQAEVMSAKESLELFEKSQKNDKDTIETLKVQLDGAEARHLAELDEMKAMRETLEEMTKKIESVTIEKEELVLAHSNARKRLQKMEAEKADWQKKSDEDEKEKNSLISTICSLEVKVGDLEQKQNYGTMEEDRYFALQTAYNMMKSELREQHNVLDAKKRRENKLVEMDRKNKATILDLQAKLKQGELEWKNLAKEKSDLERKCRQLKKESVSGHGQTAVASFANFLKRSTSIGAHSGNDLTRDELQQINEQVCQELEETRTKKDKYKQKYIDEKQRLVTLKDYYTAELAKKDTELALSREAIERNLNGAYSPKKDTKSAISDKVNRGGDFYISRGAIPKFQHPGPIVYPEIKPPIPSMMDEQPPAAANSAPILKPLPAPHASSKPALPSPAVPERQISGGNEDDELDTTVTYKHETVDKKQEEDSSESDDDNEGADRFHDAPEGPPESCCVCHAKFGPSPDVDEMTKHVNEHLTTYVPGQNRTQENDEYLVCPICDTKYNKEQTSNEDFYQHVNSHFNDNDC